jgi:perosamine synthetase
MIGECELNGGHQKEEGRPEVRERGALSVSAPVFGGNERAYVLQALDEGWISSGRFVARFAAQFGARFGATCIPVSSGTAALHLALLALGIGPGDEVLVPALTFIATANAVAYCGATPIVVDVDPLTWCIDVDEAAAARTARTKAVIPVDLYGYPVDTDALRAALPGVPIIEDACEAIGAEYAGQPAGALADLAVFSFHASKTLATGEGGAIITRDAGCIDRITLLARNGQRERRYSHEVVGYNYRLTDIQAAIGCAQLEQWAWMIARRRVMAMLYRSHLPPGVRMQHDPANGWHGRWAMAVLLPAGIAPDTAADHLARNGIETRPFFTPTHHAPMYRANAPHPCPVADDLAAHGLVLPLHGQMREPHVRRVMLALRDAL